MDYIPIECVALGLVVFSNIIYSFIIIYDTIFDCTLYYSTYTWLHNCWAQSTYNASLGIQACECDQKVSEAVKQKFEFLRFFLKIQYQAI